jgi:hypothetical protein
MGGNGHGTYSHVCMTCSTQRLLISINVTRRLGSIPRTSHRVPRRMNVRPIIALSPIARKPKKPHPRSGDLLSTTHDGFRSHGNLALPGGSGYLESEMLFSGCYEFCVVHEEEKVRRVAKDFCRSAEARRRQNVVPMPRHCWVESLPFSSACGRFLL